MRMMMVVVMVIDGDDYDVEQKIVPIVQIVF